MPQSEQSEARGQHIEPQCSLEAQCLSKYSFQFTACFTPSTALSSFFLLDALSFYMLLTPASRPSECPYQDPGVPSTLIHFMPFYRRNNLDTLVHFLCQ